MNLIRLPTTISKDERRFLERLARGRNCPQKIVLHVKIVLRFADGMRKAAIAKELSTSRPTVDPPAPGKHYAKNRHVHYTSGIRS